MAEADPPRHKTFTYRAVAIGLACLVLLAFWVVLRSYVSPNPASLVANSPPAGAVSIFLAVMVLCAGVGAVRGRLKLSKGELVVVYTMLLTAAPFFAGGMWGRFLALTLSPAREAEYLDFLDGYSDKLWPHGPHLVAKPLPSDATNPDVERGPSDRVRPVDVLASQVGRTQGVALDGAASAGAEPAVYRFRVHRWRDGRQVLVPGERYHLSALFKAEGLASESALILDLVPDRRDPVSGKRKHVPVASVRADTVAYARDPSGKMVHFERFSQPGGFKRVGQSGVKLPRELDDYVDVVVTLTGPGTGVVADVNFFNTEALYRLHSGVQQVPESKLDELGPNERDSLLVRPDRPASPRGIWYRLKGYISYSAWTQPIFFWGSIFMATFLALLGINVIFRKQWADKERFSFPLLRIPQQLLAERMENGRVIHPLFRTRAFQIGILVAFGYCVLLGLAEYVSGMPSPRISVNLFTYFKGPMRTFVRGHGKGTFSVSLLMVSVAFFIELDLLLSIVLFHWICKVPFYFGHVFGWRKIPGPVRGFPFTFEQQIGSYLALAATVFWISRRHLCNVWRRIVGKEKDDVDAGEGMRYRAAVLLVIGSFIYFGLWGRMTGVGSTNTLLLFGFLVICGVSAARIRAECGFPTTGFTPVHPAILFFLLGGVFVFKTELLVLACLMGVLVRSQWLIFAPTQVEMLQLARTEKADPRGIKWALIVGAAAGILIGGYAMMNWCYGRGGDNVASLGKRTLESSPETYRPLRMNLRDADTAVSRAASTGEDLDPKTFPGAQVALGVGFVLTLILVFLRARFVGFWLHPLGYVLAYSLSMDYLWGSLLVAWAIKWVALKVGGPRVIRSWFNPFFVGIFVGSLCGIVFWDGIALWVLARGGEKVFGCWP